MSKTSNNTVQHDTDKSYTPVTFLGHGSYKMMREKKSQKGMFWTILENKYWLMEVKSSSVKESNFSSYAELSQYIQKKFPDAHLRT